MSDMKRGDGRTGVQVSGLGGCFMAAFILIGSFGGMLFLIVQALEELN